MSRSTVLVLGLCVLSVYSAVVKTKDETLNRIARSPHHHDDSDLPPPRHGPPPPVIYHTQNWSGVAKGVGGTPQGVFSGAAASAQSSAPSISEAFSIASSGTGLDTSDKGGQVKENLGKSGLVALSNNGGPGRHSPASLASRFGGDSSDFSSSSEEQYNVKYGSGYSDDGATQSEESKRLSGKFNTVFNKKSGGSVSVGYGGSSGQFKSADFDRESGQRSINTGFGRKSSEGESGRYGSQYGDFKAHIQTENRGDIGPVPLTGDTSANRASIDFDSKSGQFNIDTSNKARSPGYNGQSLNNAESSNGQFGQYNGQSSRYGYERGARREFGNHNYGNGKDHSYHYDDIHRHGKSHEFHNFGPSGKQFGYQGNTHQDFAENGQSRSNGFSDSQSSIGGYRRNNYGPRSNGARASYSDNAGQVEQFGNLESGSTAGLTDSQAISGGQQVKQSGQLEAGFSKSQADSQRLSTGQSQSDTASRYGYKNSVSFIGENEKALAGGTIKDGISPAGVPQVPLSAGVGASGQEDVQSTLGGALNLASQGLQTAQRAPCSTCSKGSYALSNAKSHSGSAIALSIGG